MKRGARQRGMSLVVAIFLITVIASLAAFAVTVGTAKTESANLQLQADRALAAAHAGMEWAAYRARVAHVCPNGAFNLTQGALRGFRVTVTTTPAAGTGPHTEGPVNYRVCDVNAFAQLNNFGAANYASRSIDMRFTTEP